MNPSYTIRVNTPSSTIYVNVVEEAGRISDVVINAGKTGTEVFACCSAVAALISCIVKQERGLEKVLEAISNITADKSRGNSDNVQCRSIPEGIYYALIQYRDIKYKELKDYAGDFVEDKYRG